MGQRVGDLWIGWTGWPTIPHGGGGTLRYAQEGRHWHEFYRIRFLGTQAS
jgi:hypothetical protein